MTQTNKTKATFIYSLLLTILLAVLLGCGDMNVSSGNAGFVPGGGNTGSGSGTHSGGGIIVGGIGTGGTGVVKASSDIWLITGQVPFDAAVVFYDNNNNGQLDPGEPFTSTDSQGNYTLTLLSAPDTDIPVLMKTIANETTDLASGNKESESQISTITIDR